MRCLLRVLVALCALARALATHHDHRHDAAVHAEFQAFARAHGKHYATADEYNKRLGVFAHNRKYIHAHNTRPHSTFKLAMNHLGDLTPSEVRALMANPRTAQGASFLDVGVGVPLHHHHPHHNHHAHHDHHHDHHHDRHHDHHAPNHSDDAQGVLAPDAHAREHALQLVHAADGAVAGDGPDKPKPLPPDKQRAREQLIAHLQKTNHPDIFPSKHVAAHLHRKHHHNHNHNHNHNAGPHAHHTHHTAAHEGAAHENTQPPTPTEGQGSDTTTAARGAQQGGDNTTPPQSTPVHSAPPPSAAQGSTDDVLNRAVSPFATNAEANYNPFDHTDFQHAGDDFEKEYEPSSRPEDNIAPENDDRYFEIPPLDLSLPPTATCPAVVDWRTKNVLSKVLNQGECGACYAFITAQSIESAVAIKTGNFVPLSSQQIIDCSGMVGNHGCVGGGIARAMTYIMQTSGLVSEEDYGFKERAGECELRNNAVLYGAISGYVNVSGGNETLLRFAVAQNPVATSVDAHHQSFLFYASGVYDEPECTDDVTHGALIVGYGQTEDNEKYWILKNSWSDLWGLGGYMLLARDAGNKCGVATEAYFPVL